MMLEKYTNWRNSVIELNNSATAISENRHECYSWMSRRIKQAFQDSHNPIPRVHFESDASRIVCSWDDVRLNIPVTLIIGLHMPFGFDKRLNEDGEWEKLLIFYPLEE